MRYSTRADCFYRSSRDTLVFGSRALISGGDRGSAVRGVMSWRVVCGSKYGFSTGAEVSAVTLSYELCVECAAVEEGSMRKSQHAVAGLTIGSTSNSQLFLLSQHSRTNAGCPR